MKLVIATSNAGKLREMQELLSAQRSWTIVSLRDFLPFEMPPENGKTMAQNARIKALFCMRKLQLPCLADDSGLEVDALKREPGVRSARWYPGTDQERNTALLARLQGVPSNQRSARFRCALSLAISEGEMYESEGICEGRIATASRGDNGFGYDPIFEVSHASDANPWQIGHTMAEISSSQKAVLSHRARAVAALLKLIDKEALQGD